MERKSRVKYPLAQQYSRMLVAGGAGFIGSHIVDKLLEAGAEVTVLDNLYSGQLENMEQHRRNKNFHFVKGDVRNVKQVKDIVKNDGCILRLMFWGKHLWGLDGVKQARKLIKLVMDTFGLKVIYAGTADPKIVKMAKFVGFKLKSTRQDGFRWNGVSYPSYQLEINGG